ncbi:monocarboxylate transporter 9-like [Diadema antillarum]|uniref:monocarboxylate transporter 9-like n=1 Tax=Diadema antillarum TaxID=105358 RepID=UPI003A8629A2
MEPVRHRLTQGVKRWFILMGVFFVSFLETGTVRSFGVILNDMTSDFGTSTAYIGTIIGMAHGATYWLSVMNTPLLRRFSVRQVVMVGGLVGSAGLILSSLANIGSQFAAALFMFGIGFSTVVLPANSSPVDYFPDLFEIASSINLTGGGIGLMILPLLFEVFVENYGWRGALMILGAINLNTMVSGALMEPIPKAEATATSSEEDLQRRMKEKEEQEGGGHSGACHSASDSQSQEGAASTSEDQLDEVHELLNDHRTAHNGGHSSANTNSNCKATGKNVLHRISGGGETPNGSAAHATEFESSAAKSCEIVACYDATSNSVAVKENIAAMDYEKERQNKQNFVVRWFRGIAKLFDLFLFVDYPIFFGICLATILFGVSYDGWVLFVIPNAEAKGFNSQMAVYIATAGGVGNILGRFLIGFFTAKRILRNEFTYLLLNLMSAVAFCLNFAADTFWFLAILSFINGFSLGSKTSLQFIIVNGAVATERYKPAVSMLLVSLGVGFPISGALLGGIYDQTKSYNVSFCVIGFIDVICGFLISAPLFASCCRRWRRRGGREPVPTDEPAAV